MTNTKVLRKKQAVKSVKLPGDEINEEIKGYQVGFWVCAEKTRNYQKVLSLRVPFLGFSNSIPLTAALGDAECKGTRSEASATAQAKDGALNQDYNSVVGLLMVCKWDVKGAKNNKACVLKKRRVPSTEAGKTLGRAGGLRGRVGAKERIQEFSSWSC